MSKVHVGSPEGLIVRLSVCPRRVAEENIDHLHKMNRPEKVGAAPAFHWSRKVASQYEEYPCTKFTDETFFDQSRTTQMLAEGVQNLPPALGISGVMQNVNSAQDEDWF